MIPTPTFHTQRLVFAPVNGEKEDLAIVKLLYADPVTQAYGNPGPSKPYTDAQAMKSYEWTKTCILAVNICLPKSPEEPKVAGEVVGFMNLGSVAAGSPHRRTYFGITFRPEFTDKGYGTEALEWLLEQAFKRFNLHKVTGETVAWNARARAVYAKVGFREEGQLKDHVWQEGEWHDEVVL
ncbi:hypothetical protein RQP46_008687 [Phenoliferia psychrophenolica]